MRWEKVAPINLFRNNTAAFVHELPAEAILSAAGESNYVTRKTWKLFEHLREFIRELDANIEERLTKWRVAFALGKPFVYVYPKKQGFLSIKIKGGKSKGESNRVTTEKSVAYLKEDVR